MAGFGPPPKINARRTNADTFSEDAAEVAGLPTTAPELPNPKRWLKATRDWWEAWVSSPQSALFVATDWQRLTMLLPLVDGYNREKDPLRAVKLMGEIRQNESALGATHLDRLRARIKVSDGSSQGPAGGVGSGADVIDLADYGAMFGGA
ncbi:hypothetical protein OG401_23785 [Kitasatospora purpeofusca]|uniref:phage terminase small subunit n=1 Tax=Kitasatospora purpeofusca TaxID=67352 RepID=UPI002257E990|nr:hypothetical protein [Kitasatospora purpeofusca]MCX4687285.1 hypothetical protein [Kitasatospora purpeofusca]